ncbi:MAG: SDR family oxidoreductase, partial [Rubrobacter sp.]
MTVIAGKVAVVTGGARGIGRLVALRLARLGARVVVYDLDRTGIDAVLREILSETGRKAHGYVCDVSNRETVYETARRVRYEVGTVSILVNNAGVISGARLMEIPDERIEATMRINALALFWMTKSFLPEMLAVNSGHVVTVASAAGLVGVDRQTDYSASKHAAIGFGESLRAELRNSGHDGVKTTLMEPYYVDTGMFSGVKTKPRLGLPLLKEEYVTGKIVEAIEHDRLEVRLPPLINLTPVLRAL